MASMVLGDSTLESLTPSANAPLYLPSSGLTCFINEPTHRKELGQININYLKMTNIKHSSIYRCKIKSWVFLEAY
jgi:hypothetical protein